MKNLVSRIKAHREVSKFKTFLESPVETQKDTLLRIIKKNAQCKFGIDHRFNQITTIQEYQNNVPVFDYNTLYPYIEQAQEKSNILTQEAIIHWILTSGTTDVPKKLPMTESGLQAWSLGSGRALYCDINYNSSQSRVMNGKILANVAPAVMDYVDEIPLGYISGVAGLRNRLLQFMMAIPEDIININDYEKRLQEITKLVVTHNITVITGITSFTLNLLLYIHKKAPSWLIEDEKYAPYIENALENGRLNLKKLWPDLQLFVNTGVPLAPYKNRIKQLLGKDVDIYNMYTASEGAYGVTLEPEDRGMALNLDLYFFEFMPMHNNDPPVAIDQVELNQKYEMLITNPSGLYRYKTGDIVEIVSIEPLKIDVIGRKKHTINLTSEKITQKQVQRCLSIIANKYQLDVTGYFFFGWIDSNAFVHHCLAIEFGKNSPNDITSIMEEFKVALTKCNGSYREYIKTVIRHPHHVILRSGTLDQLEYEKSSIGGQIGYVKICQFIERDDFIKIFEDKDILTHDLPPDFFSTDDDQQDDTATNSAEKNKWYLYSQQHRNSD